MENFMVHPENQVIGFVLLPISPAELGKTTNTTFTTSNNAFDKPCAEPSSLGLCHGEKGYHEMEPTRFARIAILLQGKQQNTRLRQDITPGEISRKCVQGEALFIVVSLAATLGQHGPRRGDVSPRSVVTCCKSCSSCFPCVHVESLNFREEPFSIIPY